MTAASPLGEAAAVYPRARVTWTCFPPVTVRSPFKATFPASVFVPDNLLNVRLLNVLAEIVCAPLPLKITVPVPE